MTPQEKLSKVASITLLQHRRRTMQKYGITGAEIDTELHRRVAEKTSKERSK